MKLLTEIKALVLAVAILLISALTSNVYALSSTNSSKVKDFKLKPPNGKLLKRSDISLAIRKHYEGVRPRIAKRKLSGKPNCYDVKFIYKNQLKRVSFNCTTTKLVMQAKY